MKCVICTNKCSTANIGRGDDCLLEAQLSVVYFLSEFIQDLDNLINLEELIVSNGNPSDWIGFCDPCLKWVKEGRKLYKRLKDLEIKLASLKKKVYNTVRNTSKEDGDRENGNDLIERVRRIIILDSRRRQPGRKVVRNNGNGRITKCGSGAMSPSLNESVEIKVESNVEDFEDESHNYDELEQFSENVIYPENHGSDRSPGHCDEDRLKYTKQEKEEDCWELSSDDNQFDEQNFDDNEFILPNLESDSNSDYESKRPRTRSNNPTSALQRLKNNRNTEKCKITKHQDDSEFDSDDMEDNEDEMSDPDFIVNKKTSPDKMDKDYSTSKQKAETCRKSPAVVRTCPFCNRLFDRPSMLTKHLNKDKNSCTISNGDETNIHISCPVCSNIFDTKISFATHFRSHTTLSKNNKIPLWRQKTVPDLLENKKRKDTDNNSSTSKQKAETCRKSPAAIRTCPFCNRLFDRPSKLTKHLNKDKNSCSINNSNEGDMQISCPVCSNIFDNKSLFAKHFKTHTTLSKYNTPSSWRQKTDPDLMKNKQISPNKRKDTDKDSPTSKSKADTHRKSPTAVRTCPFCNRLFDRPSMLTKHLNKDKNSCTISNGDEGDIHISCPVCSKIFDNKSLFAKHFRSHTTTSNNNTPPLWCRKTDESKRICPHPECNGKIFASLSKLKLHLICKHKEIKEAEMFKCHLCPKTFAVKAYLKEHEWFHLTPDEKLKHVKSLRSKVPVKDKTCPVCHIVFMSISKMRVHLNNTHEKVKLHHCEVCGKGFTRKDSYLDHLNSHLDTEQREALMAGASVTVQTGPEMKDNNKTVTLKLKTVTKAMAVSTRSCPTCGKLFSSRSRMTLHLKSVHQKSTTVICEVCGISMGCKRTLNIHMKYHEMEPGIKPFLCSECGIGYKHRWALRRHRLLTHNPNTDLRKFPCPMCEKAYPFHSLLHQHQKARQHFVRSQTEDNDFNVSSSNTAPSEPQNDATTSNISHQLYPIHFHQMASFGF